MGFLAGAPPLISAGAGLLGSAFGKSGKQGGQSATGTVQRTGESTGTRQDTGRNVLEQFEDPSLSPFRQEFMGGLSDELARVQEPIFGEGQQAAFLGQLNQLTNQAGQNITNRLAATGASRSGSAEDQLTNLEIGRGSQAANFFAQLPFMEEQARRSSTASLLGQGLGFAGRGVTNQVQTTDQSSEFDFDEMSNQTSQQDTDVEGPGFLRSLAGAGGDLLGGLLGANPSDPFSVFKKKPSGSSVQTSEIPLGAGQGNRLDQLLNTYKINPISFGG